METKEDAMMGDDPRARLDDGPFVVSTVMEPTKDPLERFVPEGVTWIFKWYDGVGMSMYQVYFQYPGNLLLLQRDEEYHCSWYQPDWVNLHGPKIDDPEKAIAWIKQALVEKFETGEIMFVIKKS